jgi:rhodanese-related sulfurtransferase
LQQGNHLRLVDVREPHELEISQLEGAQLTSGAVSRPAFRAGLRRRNCPVLQRRDAISARPGAVGKRRFSKDQESKGWHKCLGARG